MYLPTRSLALIFGSALVALALTVGVSQAAYPPRPGRPGLPPAWAPQPPASTFRPVMPNRPARVQPWDRPAVRPGSDWWRTYPWSPYNIYNPANPYSPYYNPYWRYDNPYRVAPLVPPSPVPVPEPWIGPTDGDPYGLSERD
jgi:hypothetical protein